MFKPLAIYAISQNDLNSILNDTEFFSPSSACQAQQQAGGVSVSSTGDNPQIALDFFSQNGFANYQAAGIVGNLYVESVGVDPERLQNNFTENIPMPPDPNSQSIGWGIAQWTPPSKILNYAASVNENPDLLSTQLQFIMYQLSTSYASVATALRASTNVSQATLIFLLQYERAGVLHINSRIADAEQVLAQYGGNLPSTSSNSSASGSILSTSSAQNQTNSCGYQTSNGLITVTSASSGYQNPLRSVTNLSPERIDQGVDYSGSGPVYAIGPAKIVDVQGPATSGWEGEYWINYQLTSGPASGYYIYVAENCTPLVTVGQVVDSNTPICTMIDQYPNIETGWAQSPSNGDVAMAFGEGAGATNFGQNFSEFLASLGAPPGNIKLSGGILSATLPAGWITFNNN